ncbi:MAG: ABC transporter permease subunit [Pseudobdellovibrionaceae bacterium]|nr:ABC transporter permease subunit [Bdellovibrionales bacterium]USN48873.1 MAG: ABC transporter permease subunit [Pseudobdellovibrionaceae bacterium]
MRAITTIAWKDFRLMVTSPMFFMIAGLCSVIWSYSYLRNLVMFAQRSSQMAGAHGMQGSMNIHFSLFVQHISYVNIIFIFAIPALTMRLIAEEKKLSTFNLLLTSPITATDIAVGKFLAGFGGAMALMAVALLYPLATTFISDFPVGPLVTSFTGLALMTGAYVAAGLFASSLTQSVVLSVVMGVIFNLIMWFLGQGSDMSDNATVMAVLEHLSIGQHFFSFLKGGFRVSSIVFFVSVIGLFVFLTQRVVEASRWR